MQNLDDFRTPEIDYIEHIFNSITPENIRMIPLLKDTMGIFIKVLQERCGVSINTRNIFNEKNNDTARDEFIKIYLDDLNRYLVRAQTDSTITEELERINISPVHNIPRDFTGDLTYLFNNEHFLSTKGFNQKKGTAAAIDYVFSLIERMVLPENEQNSFEFIPGIPFTYEVEGALPESMFHRIVKPLSHPLGFTYGYTRIMKLILEDFYGCVESYKNITIEVRCLDSEPDVYGDGRMTSDTESTPRIPQDTANVMNNLSIKSIYKGYNDTPAVLRITFEDGSYLEQTFAPIEIVYYAEDHSVIKRYLGHCSIFMDYDSDVECSLDDSDLTFEVEPLWWDSWCLDNDYYGPYPGIENYCSAGWDYIIGEFTIGDGGIIGSNHIHGMHDEYNFEVIFDTRKLRRIQVTPGWIIGDGKKLDGPRTFLGPQDWDYEEQFTSDSYVMTAECSDGHFDIELIP